MLKARNPVQPESGHHFSLMSRSVKKCEQHFEAEGRSRNAASDRSATGIALHFS